MRVRTRRSGELLPSNSSMFARDSSYQDAGGDSALIPPATPLLNGIVVNNNEAAARFPRTVVGSHTMCNHGKSNENQDSYVSKSSTTGSKSLIGVFDGHGEQGKRVSEFASTQIARSLFTNRDLQSDPVSALASAFMETQQKIERAHSFDAFHSGTTAVAAYKHRNRLYVANVGDSRAVLGCALGTSRSGSHEPGILAVDLSSDHRPDRDDEKRRILADGGTVHQSAIPMRQTFGGPPRLVRVGPERVWDRTGRCGLCVTRSLGDISMHPWVTAIPEVTEREIGPKDKLVILGSDGVWDRVASQEAVDIAARHRDPSAAAREITSVARQRWYQQTDGQMSDDITAVVMNLDHGTPPPSRMTEVPTPGRNSQIQLPGTAGGSRGGRRPAAEAALRRPLNRTVGNNSQDQAALAQIAHGPALSASAQLKNEMRVSSAKQPQGSRLPPMVVPMPMPAAGRKSHRR